MKKFLLGLLSLVLVSCGSVDDNINVITREKGSGTRGAFIELFDLKKKVDGKKVDMISKEAMVENNTNTVITTVSSDENSIGYISMGSVNDKIKVLKIDGVEATKENIVSGKYKIFRPFNIAIKNKDNSLVNDFITYILSEQGQKIVTKHYISAIGDTKKFVSKMPIGTITIGGSSSVSPLMEKLIEDYNKINSNAKIQLQTSDSTTGMNKTIEGLYDIGMASRELKEKEKARLENIVISLDGIAVITNIKNKIDNISKQNITDIYEGKITKWSEIN